jgi:PmbA protein
VSDDLKTIRDRLAGQIDAAKRQGASAAKIRWSRGERIGADFEAGRLKNTTTNRELRYDVEVLVEGRLGAARGNRLEDLDEIVSRAVTLAKSGSVAHFDAWPAPGEYADAPTFSEATAGLGRQGMVASCRRIVDRLRNEDPDLHIEAGASRSVGEGLLVTSGGVSEHRRRSKWSLGAHVQRTEQTDMLFAGYGRSWRELNELWDPETISGRIVEDLRHGRQVVDIPAGRMPVLLPPELVATMLQGIELGVNGRNVARGNSPLAGRLGEPILDESITLVDDPHLPYAAGSRSMDADGVPTRKTTIFEKGVLRTFLYDLDSAGLAGAEPTGHDGCSPSNPEILPGETPSAKLLEAIDDGIYIKYLIGFGQGNILNGDFSCNVGLGFRVKGGRIVGRVKNVMAAGNLYELLRENVRVSSDRDPTKRLPYLLAPKIAIAAAPEG